MWKVAEGDNGVIVARFDRPPMNYYTDEDIGQLEELVAEWTARQVPAVVLAGGRPGKFITHFEVDGILLKQVEPEGPIESPVRSRRIHVLTQNMNKAPMPIIAALNGDAMGVGFELALSADIRVGERADHRYGLIETRLGIVPGGTGLTRMARMIGPGKAMLLGAGARALTPEEAFEAGLVELLEDDAVASGDRGRRADGDAAADGGRDGEEDRLPEPGRAALGRARLRARQRLPGEAIARSRAGAPRLPLPAAWRNDGLGSNVEEDGMTPEAPAATFARREGEGCPVGSRSSPAAAAGSAGRSLSASPPRGRRWR